MQFIKMKFQREILLIKLSRGITNPIDLEMVIQLSKLLQNVKNDPKIKGLVLSSTNEKFFSIGFNIPHLYEQNKAAFTVFYQAFNRLCLDLYTFPKPTVAAITGHAIAGGCILALLCDYRFIAEGKKLMGLNEIKLGVPVPFLADCVLNSIAGSRIAREIMSTGEFYEPEESLEMGLVDQVLPLGEVLSHSVAKARLLGALPQRAFQLIKLNRVESLEKQVLKRQKEKEKVFIECWFSSQTRKLLKEAMEKF